MGQLADADRIREFLRALSAEAEREARLYFTGGATACERERPCGLSGCVTTARTSNPSPSSASREGTANSGVPKKTTRTYSSPAGSGTTSLR